MNFECAFRGVLVDIGNDDFAIFSIRITDIKGPQAKLFVHFYICFGLLPGACFLSFSVFFGFPLAPF